MTTQAALDIPDIEALLDEARARTGLDDFGPPSFRESLGKYLASMRAEQRYFAPEGVAFVRRKIIARLSERLRIEEWYRHHPEVEDEQPEKPLLITGLPRTGTSALASILSLEPAFRCLRHWEREAPVPPPEPEGDLTDPRRLAFIEEIERMKLEHPELMAKHLWEIDATEEDGVVLGLACQEQEVLAPTFSYLAWWRDSDMDAAYAYQRRVVKLLQSRRPPNRWLFKAPHYAFHVEAICRSYPDARFLVSHRDPVKAVPSWISLVSSLPVPGTPRLLPPAELGRELVRHQEIAMRRMIAARARLGEDRFIDVHHHDFVADPVGVVRRVYDFIDLPFVPETERRMQAWFDENRPGAHGAHVYSASQFGLDERDIRERFAFYTDQYGVRLERMAG